MQDGGVGDADVGRDLLQADAGGAARREPRLGGVEDRALWRPRPSAGAEGRPPPWGDAISGLTDEWASTTYRVVS
jgi:hypothetical protein